MHSHNPVENHTLNLKHTHTYQNEHNSDFETKDTQTGHEHNSEFVHKQTHTVDEPIHNSNTNRSLNSDTHRIRKQDRILPQTDTHTTHKEYEHKQTHTIQNSVRKLQDANPKLARTCQRIIIETKKKRKSSIEKTLNCESHCN